MPTIAEARALVVALGLLLPAATPAGLPEPGSRAYEVRLSASRYDHRDQTYGRVGLECGLLLGPHAEPVLSVAYEPRLDATAIGGGLIMNVPLRDRLALYLEFGSGVQVMVHTTGAWLLMGGGLRLFLSDRLALHCRLDSRQVANYSVHTGPVPPDSLPIAGHGQDLVDLVLGVSLLPGGG